jgi:hypothetical protein
MVLQEQIELLVFAHRPVELLVIALHPLPLGTLQIRLVCCLEVIVGSLWERGWVVVLGDAKEDFGGGIYIVFLENLSARNSFVLALFLSEDHRQNFFLFCQTLLKLLCLVADLGVLGLGLLHLDLVLGFLGIPEGFELFGLGLESELEALVLLDMLVDSMSPYVDDVMVFLQHLIQLLAFVDDLLLLVGLLNGCSHPHLPFLLLPLLGVDHGHESASRGRVLADSPLQLGHGVVDEEGLRLESQFFLEKL